MLLASRLRAPRLLPLAPLVRLYTNGAPGPSSSSSHSATRRAERDLRRSNSRPATLAEVRAILSSPSPDAARPLVRSRTDAPPHDRPDRPRRFVSRYSADGPQREREFPLSRFSRRDRDPRDPRVQADRRAGAGAAGGPSQPRTPRELSFAIHKWIDRRAGRTLTTPETDELLALVEGAPRLSVNAPVWNLVLGILGKEGRMSTMWKAFNNMKKRGIAPTTRTYTTLLSAYAGPAGMFTPSKRPEALTLSRVALIYDQAMAHMRATLARPAEASDDSGLASTSRPAVAAVSDSDADADVEKEVNLRPVHAYLRFLGRYGLYRTALTVLVALPSSGPLKPDAASHTILFHALNQIARHVRAGSSAPVDAVRVGEDARALWDTARKGDTVDPELVLAAMQALSMGRLEDQRLAEELVPAYFAVDPPTAAPAANAGSSTSSIASASSASSAPTEKFPLTVRAATSLLNILSHSRSPSLAAHYAHRVLADPPTARAADTPLLRLLVRVFSNVHDIDAIRTLLDTYQPTAPRAPWTRDAWHDALWAARWARDWEAALAVFRRMTHLAPGVENGHDPRIHAGADADADAGSGAHYVWQPPNGFSTDCRGVKWARPAPLAADVKAATLLLQAALSVGVNPIRQALRVVEHILPGLDGTPTLELAKVVEGATERVLEVSKDEGERARMARLRKTTEGWRAALDGPRTKSGDENGEEADGQRARARTGVDGSVERGARPPKRSNHGPRMESPKWRMSRRGDDDKPRRTRQDGGRYEYGSRDVRGSPRGRFGFPAAVEYSD
ncbi:hypothetical protein Q5752_006596 [Cryptotrichosporon argae]